MIDLMHRVRSTPVAHLWRPVEVLGYVMNAPFTLTIENSVFEKVKNLDYYIYAMNLLIEEKRKI